MGPLQGIKVVDMSRFIAGPYCGMILGDMGADVIKVEKPKVGEESRGNIPFVGEVSSYFLQYNKNKKSLALNTRSEKGKEILTELIKSADVLIENFKPGTMKKMGYTDERLKELNPGLVVVHISGFGQEGPWSSRACFDCIAQAVSGVMSLTGDKDGDPMKPGPFLADCITGFYATIGVLSALYSRQQTGKGQVVDVALLDSLVSTLGVALTHYIGSGVIEPRWGNRDNICAPATLFQAKDGPIYVHAGTQNLFESFVKILGKPELLEDPRFCDNHSRFENMEASEQLMKDFVCDKTVKELDAIFAEAGIPAGPVNDMKGVVENEQLAYRKAIEYFDYPGAGRVGISGITVKLSETPGELRYLPPLLGEHTEQILREELNMSEEEIKKLYEDGVI